MGKSSGLAVFALILGIAGLGFGVFSYVNLNQTIILQGSSSVHRTYYDNRTASYVPPSSITYYDIPDINISFQVDSGESVYFSFTCWAYLTRTSSTCTMSFRFNIDDTPISESAVTVGTHSGDETSLEFSVALQHVAPLLTAGNHEVTVEVSRNNDGYVYHSYLLVQTFNS